MTYRLVLIEWEDSAEDKRGWRPFDDREPEPLLCRTVGWLEVDGPRSKVIVTSRYDGNPEQGIRENCCGGFTIPTACVRRIVDLVDAAETMPNAKVARPDT